MLTSGSLFISFIPTWGGMCTNAYIRQLVYQFHTNLGRHVYKCLHQAACLSVSYQPGAACVQMLTSGSLFISFIPTWGGMCTNAYIRQLVYQFHTNLGRHVYKCSRSMLNDPKVVPASCPILVDVTALDQLAFESTVWRQGRVNNPSSLKASLHDYEIQLVMNSYIFLLDSTYSFEFVFRGAAMLYQTKSRCCQCERPISAPDHGIPQEANGFSLFQENIVHHYRGTLLFLSVPKAKTY
ncbi:hypothetical protein J6590_053533 [Homalodisca vitripennis]|nr:hypothetical protein J6590_053533 [Homalodisca vitripennis]